MYKQPSNPLQPDLHFEEIKAKEAKPGLGSDRRIRELEEKNAEYLETIERHEVDLEQQLLQIRTLRTNTKELEETLKSFKSRESEHRTELAKVETAVSATQREAAQVENRLKMQLAELSETSRNKDSIISELQENVETLQFKLDSAQKDLAEQNKKTETTQAAALDLQQKLNYSNISNAQLQQKLTDVSETRKREEAASKEKLKEVSAEKDQVIFMQYRSDIEALVSQIGRLKVEMSKERRTVFAQTEPPDLTFRKASSLSITPERKLKGKPVLQTTLKLHVPASPRVYHMGVETVLGVDVQTVRRLSRLSVARAESVVVVPESDSHALNDSEDVQLTSIRQSKDPSNTAHLEEANPAAVFESGQTVTSNPFEETEQVESTLLDLLATHSSGLKPMLEITADNEPFDYQLVIEPQGILYTCESLEVAFRVSIEDALCQFYVRIATLGQTGLTISDISVLDNVVAAISRQQVPEIVNEDSPAKLLITISAHKPFTDFPYLKFSYRTASSSSFLTLKLPVTFLRFMNPSPTAPEKTTEVWEGLKEFGSMKEFVGLKPEIRSLAVLRTVLGLGNRMQIYSAGQIPELKKTWLLASGECCSRTVLCLVALHPDATGGVVTTFSHSAKVRSALLSLILYLIS